MSKFAGLEWVCPWQAAIEDAKRGNLKPLAEAMKSDLSMTPKVRDEIAALLLLCEVKRKPKLTGLQAVIAKWFPSRRKPAVALALLDVQEAKAGKKWAHGVEKAAIEKASKEHGVSELTLHNAVHRSKKPRRSAKK